MPLPTPVDLCMVKYMKSTHGSKCPIGTVSLTYNLSASYHSFMELPWGKNFSALIIAQYGRNERSHIGGYRPTGQAKDNRSQCNENGNMNWSRIIVDV